MYLMCRKPLNEYLLSGTISVIVQITCFFIGKIVTPKDLYEHIIMVIMAAVMMLVFYFISYIKYLHDIFFKRAEIYTGYITNKEKYINKEDRKKIAKSSRWIPHPQVRLWCCREKPVYIKSVRGRRNIGKIKRADMFICHKIPLCEELLKNQKVEILYLKSTNTVVDIKAL